MSSLQRRYDRRPARRKEVQGYVQKQFTAWAARQVRVEPARLLILGVGAALVASVIASVLVLSLLSPRLDRIDARVQAVKVEAGR